MLYYLRNELEDYLSEKVDPSIKMLTENIQNTNNKMELETKRLGKYFIEFHLVQF